MSISVAGRVECAGAMGGSGGGGASAAAAGGGGGAAAAASGCACSGTSVAPWRCADRRDAAMEWKRSALKSTATSAHPTLSPPILPGKMAAVGLLRALPGWFFSVCEFQVVLAVK